MYQTSRTLLIVDDSPADREFYQRCLRRDPECCYTILEATLGQQGLDLWQRHQPDVVLLDYRLPDLDGLEFLTQLQSWAQTQYLPVIVVTGQGNEAIAVQAMKTGAQDYLVKEQLSAEVLRFALNSAMTDIQLRQQLQQSEAARRQSEERLRSTLKASRMGTWDWNIQTGQIDWSDNLEALFGLEPGEFDGSFEMFVDRLHPDDRDRVLTAIDRAIATGGDYEIEFRVVYPNGKIRWSLSQGKVFYSQDGQPIRMVGNDIDITERKRSAKILRDSEERFRQLAENIDAVFWVREVAEERVSYVSPAYQRLWGLEPQELYEDNQAWIRYIHPEDRESVGRAFQERAALGQFDQEYRIVLPDGRVRWIRDRCFPLRDDEGVIYRFTGIAEDITERKQVEQVAYEGKQILDALIEYIPQGITIADASDVTIRRVSKYGEQLTGRSRENLENIPLDQHVQAWNIFYADGTTPAKAEELPLTRAVQQGEIVVNEEWILQQPNGNKVCILCNAGPIHDSNGQITGGIISWHDITHRKQTDAKRDRLLAQEQAARAEAERANRIKDEFLAVLSHELRSPLNPILGWTKLLQTRQFDSARVAEALATIERNAKLQTQLIDDLLDVAKILRGKLSMNTAPVDLVFVIDSAIDTIRTAAIAKAIDLRFAIGEVGALDNPHPNSQLPTPKFQVLGDAARLQQVIWNLLSNAIKFTPNHGRVDIRLERVDNQAQITVRDTGKGISPDFLPHIFESFRQEDASTTRQYGGLGLGLAIVRSLVEAHGGTIAADSLGEGHGASFMVKLPLLEIELDSTPSEEVPAIALDLIGIRVLAVDDEPDARMLLNTLLTLYGADVLMVDSATDVLSALESFQPDVLVSDIGMPHMDGYALIQHIRALPSERGGQVPAIALTAYAREDDAQRAIASGYQRHVTKPLEPEKLVQMVAAIVKS